MIKMGHKLNLGSLKRAEGQMKLMEALEMTETMIPFYNQRALFDKEKNQDPVPILNIDLN
jgi:hypothetical protein